MAKKYKCPYCEKRLIRKDLITHIDRSHKELIPENYTAARLVYNQVNKVDHGKCRVCGKPTAWSEKSGRYDVLCGDPKCKEHMREEYKKNMLRVKGTYNILNDPEQQKKMLANRSISGQYKFQDGGVLTYTGSYEKKCLEFMDVVMQIPSKDILSPGPTLEYEYNGEKHFYITDFYYIPYNLIIEVKDGGDNLNTKDSASMKASREKTIEKEHLITDRGEYNYIRLTNNNFAQLIEVFMIIKEKLLEGDDSKTYRINESQVVLEDYFMESSNQLYHISNRKGITNINPSIPNNFMTKNGYEENKTKRVCFAPSVDQCLMGLSRNCEGEEFYVYAPDGDYKTYTPSIKEVPDVKITGEVWIKEPVNVKCVGKIKVLDTNKSPGKSYSYGNNQTAELYAFDYKWVKNINESQVVLENTNISDIRNVINKIYQKYLKDKKPPTGNQNCQLCTWCVESWFRGINVLPRPIYSPTDIAFEFNGYDIVKNPELIKFRSKEDFKRVIHSSGNGSRYYVHVKWNGGSGGHEFMAISIDNIIYIIDAQQGIIENMDTSYVVKDYFNINYDESYMVRLDNKQFNKELLKYNNNKYIKQLTEDDMKMLEENAINEASRSNKFIRITYDGEGIYQAFKENVPFGVWKSFKNSNATNWLPLPPSYEGNYRSYFTTTGYKMFMKRTYPVMIEYLDKSKIKVEEVYLQQSNIIYEDKFQVVISEDNTINESLEDVSGIIFDKRKLFQDEYITLYHGTDLGNLKEIIPNSYNAGLKKAKSYNESCELSSSNTGIINPQWKIFADYMCTKYKVNNSIKINIKFLHSKVSFDTMSNKYNNDTNTNATIRDRNTIYVLDEDIYNNLYHDNYNNIVRYEIAWIILSKYYNANMNRTIEAICVYESGMLDEFEAYNTGKIKRAKKYKEYVDANGIAAVMRHLTSNKAIIN